MLEEILNGKKKVLVVHKESIYSLYSNSPDKDLQERITHASDPAVRAMRESDYRQKKSIDFVVKTLHEYEIAFDLYSRKDAPHTAQELENYGLIMTVGGDGTLLDMSHYVKDIPMIGINSDPKTSVGFLCAGNASHLSTILAQITCAPITQLQRIQVTINDSVIPEYALNDVLFAHKNPAETTRYEFDNGIESKNYRGSGLLVATATGSTAWIYQEGATPLEKTSKNILYFHRGVRTDSIVHTGNMPLEITSRCREGKIYIDGGHVNYPATFGDIITLKSAPPLNLITKLTENKELDYCI